MESTYARPHAVATTLEFVSVDLPHGWTGGRTVTVTDEEGEQRSCTVARALQGALRRAALLAAHNLASRLDLGLDSSGLHIVWVYWEA